MRLTPSPHRTTRSFSYDSSRPRCGGQGQELSKNPAVTAAAHFPPNHVLGLDRRTFPCSSCKPDFYLQLPPTNFRSSPRLIGQYTTRLVLSILVRCPTVIQPQKVLVGIDTSTTYHHSFFNSTSTPASGFIH